MKITLLGLEFAIENMGCQALAYSFLNILENTIKECGYECEYDVVVFREFSKLNNIYSSKVNCIKIQYKKISFWKKIWKSFKSSSIVVDFTGGDSFSDIYGLKRFFMATLIKKMAIVSGTPLMLGPQTYGPYKRRFCKLLAIDIIKKSRWVFARDDISKKYVFDLTKRDIVSTVDVAFSLPYNPQENRNDTKISVGLNVSGLLWGGGYSFAKIDMNLDYQAYVLELLDYLMSDGRYVVYLIPHVGIPGDDTQESDYMVCKNLHDKYPQTVFVGDITNPMDAKSIISSLDVFLGARMHATIAAFSSGVATIPFSYSRKFEGVFYCFDYKYIISAKNDSIESALRNSIQWIENREALRRESLAAKEIISKKQEEFAECLKEILVEVVSEK